MLAAVALLYVCVCCLLLWLDLPGLECGARRQHDEDFSVGAAQGRSFQIMMLLMVALDVVVVVPLPI